LITPLSCFFAGGVDGGVDAGNENDNDDDDDDDDDTNDAVGVEMVRGVILGKVS